MQPTTKSFSPSHVRSPLPSKAPQREHERVFRNLQNLKREGSEQRDRVETQSGVRAGVLRRNNSDSCLDDKSKRRVSWGSVESEVSKAVRRSHTEEDAGQDKGSRAGGKATPSSFRSALRQLFDEWNVHVSTATQNLSPRASCSPRQRMLHTRNASTD